MVRNKISLPKGWNVVLLLAVLGMCFLVFPGCQSQDDTKLTLEESLGKNVASAFTYTLLASDSHYKYADAENDGGTNRITGGAATACPDVQWTGVCHWIIDYGTGCYGPLGNYFSGSYSTTDCASWSFNNFCFNSNCINGTIAFSTASCPVEFCWSADVSFSLTSPDDVVTVDLNATTGTNTNQWYLYAGSTIEVVSTQYGAYSGVVTQDLYKTPACVFPTSGMITASASGGVTVTIDFNTGRCTTAYINGIEISLV